MRSLKNKECKYCKKIFVTSRSDTVKCMNKVCQQEYKNEWARLNPSYKKEWVKRNSEKRKVSSKQYQQKNWSYYVQYSSLYSRRRLQAMSKWANKEKINQIYTQAKELGLEVDHIIPLKHELVCGLHNEFNLQLLSRSDNAKKNNIYAVISKERESNG